MDGVLASATAFKAEAAVVNESLGVNRARDRPKLPPAIAPRRVLANSSPLGKARHSGWMRRREPSLLETRMWEAPWTTMRANEDAESVGSGEGGRHFDPEVFTLSADTARPSSPSKKRPDGWLKTTLSKKQEQKRPEYGNNWKFYYPKPRTAQRGRGKGGFEFGRRPRVRLTTVEATEFIVNRMIGPKERYNQKIYAIGGRDFHKRASRAVEVLDCDHLDAGWVVVGSPLREPRVSPACCAVYETPSEEDTVMGARIYVCGGVGEHGRRLRSGESYDPPNDSWFPMAPMRQARSASMTFAVGDDMYVVGGENGDAYDADDGVLRSVEIYDTEKNTWRDGPPMPIAVCAAAYGLVGDTFYVAGGRGAAFKMLTTTFAFNALYGKWTTCASLPEPVEYAASTVVGNKLYVAGGFSPEFSDELFIYDTDTDVWTKSVHVMPGPCHTLSGTNVYGKFICTGGYDMTGIRKTVEVWDPVEETWSEYPEMNVKRGAHGCVTLALSKYALARRANGVLAIEQQKKDRLMRASTFRASRASKKAALGAVDAARHWS